MLKYVPWFWLTLHLKVCLGEGTSGGARSVLYIDLGVDIHIYLRCKHFMSYDPAIPLLGIHPDKTIIWKDTCIPMFIAACTIAKTWKQPKCPWTDEWIKKMWYIYTVEYYSAICSEVDGPRVCHTERIKSEREKQISYANTYIWNLKKKKKKVLMNRRAGQE